MAERAPLTATMDQEVRILAEDEVAYENEIACLNTADGLIYPAQTGITTLIPIGHFDESMTGDGVANVRVKLFREVRIAGFDNDTAPNAVTEADIGKTVYLKDGHTVSMLSTSRSVAGRALQIIGSKVYIEGGLAVVGPAGAGTSATATAIAVQPKRIPIPLRSWGIASSGAALPAFSDGVADGIDPLGAIRFNPGATPPALGTVVGLPADLDFALDVTFKALVSKIGATIGDATTITLTALCVSDGLLHDADANMGGATDAVVGNAATKTVDTLSRVLTAANINDVSPQSLSLTMKPTNGTLGTDDFLVWDTWLEYTPRVVA